MYPLLRAFDVWIILFNEVATPDDYTAGLYPNASSYDEVLRE